MDMSLQTGLQGLQALARQRPWPPAPRPWPKAPSARTTDLARRRLGVATTWPDSAIEALLGCIQLDNRALRCSGLPLAQQLSICTLPAAAWKALHDYALAAGGPGISRVYLPDQAGRALDTAFITQGLNELPALELLIVPAMPRLAFDALKHPTGQLTLIVDNSANPHGEVQVTVPPGCRVWAAVASRHLHVESR